MCRSEILERFWDIYQIPSLVRVVSIQPNKLIGVVGSHSFPISRLRMSYDQRFLGRLENIY